MDELVTEDEGFAYKQFIFDEDDEDTKVRVNGIGEFPLYDYFVLKSVCNPETITEEGAAKRIAISVEAELALFLEKFLKENLWEEPLVQNRRLLFLRQLVLWGILMQIQQSVPT